MVLTVTEPQASGIGGGFLLTYQDKKGNIHTMDARFFLLSLLILTFPREESPAELTSKPEILIGGGSVAVPGTISGMHRLLMEHGTWKWEKVFDMAISLAETGWKLGSSISVLINRADHHRKLRCVENQGECGRVEEISVISRSLPYS